VSGRNTAAERIRSAGLRATRARIAVLEALAELDGHPTTDDVVRCLHDHGASVARASVFNVLDDFASTGIVTVASAGPGAARYEVAEEHHDHFVCRVCGAIRDVPRTRALDPLSLDADVGRIEETHVIYRGPCAACLAAGAS
jgi:Fur family ferric uptake transcriptional regulator